MRPNQLLASCSVAAAIALGSQMLWAQNPPPAPGAPPPPGERDRGRDRGRGRFDPAEFQKRVMDGIKEQLGFKDDEWTAVQPLVQKVLDLRRETLIGGFSFSRIFRRPGSEGSSSSQRSGSEGNRSPWFTPSPEAEALQKAIDDNAPAAQVKAALERYRASKKEKEAKLAAAQEELRKVLTARQEAQATLMGLLP